MNRLRFRPEKSMRFTLYNWVGGGAGKDVNLMQASSFQRAKARTFFSMAGQPDYRADDIYSGSSSFHPYFVLEDPKIGDGFFFGFNYLGPWSAKIWNPGDNEKGGFPINSQLELHIEPLNPGVTFEAPNSFIGIYKGDLDNACEQLQDWQVTFKWDYTRDKYLFLSSIVNRFWNDPAYKQKPDLHKQIMWDIAERCRRTGSQIAHEDDFWFDERGRGVWEGVDWTELVTYLGQSGIIFKLWMPPQHFAVGTPQDLEHPDWASTPRCRTASRCGTAGGSALLPKAPTTTWASSCWSAKALRDVLLADGRLGGIACQSDKHDHPPGQPFVQQYRHHLDLLREVKEANPGDRYPGLQLGRGVGQLGQVRARGEQRGFGWRRPRRYLLLELLLAGRQDDGGWRRRPGGRRGPGRAGDRAAAIFC